MKLTLNVIMLYYSSLVENMASRKKTEPLVYNCSLGEACSRYLISLTPETRAKAQPELTKFVRWYGEKRLINDLSAPEIENYSDQLTATISELTEKIDPVKDFLSYSYKHKLIQSRLAHLLKSKKNTPKSGYAVRQQEVKEITLTAEGYAELESELRSLIDERPKIAEEIHRAAADKDFRENAPLEAVKDHQGKVEGRIRELETTIKSAKILNEKQTSSRGAFLGDRIILRDLSTNEMHNYLLVDVKEANPSIGKISVNSPIGKAIVGHKYGEKIEVIAPAGILSYEILEIIQN